MGTQSGGLKAMPQKLSYSLHNLALMSAFSMSTMREHEQKEGIGKGREFSSTETLTPPSLPIMNALEIQMQEKQLLFTLGLICDSSKKHSFCKRAEVINIRSNAEGDETLTKD